MLSPKKLAFSIKTNQLANMVGFYRNVFGRPVCDEPDWASFEIGPHEIVIWQSPDPIHNVAPSIHIAVEVEDLDAAHRWIQAYSTPDPIQSTSWGRECHFEDPDDNRITLFERTSQNGS